MRPRRPFLGWMGRGLLQGHCLGHLFRLRRLGWVLSSFPGPAVCLGCGTGTLPRPFWGCRGPWACPGITKVPFPAEPSFVFADVMRESPGGGGGGDDRVYFFFTEVSVEYEFVFKLLIPRVARVCKVSASPPFLLGSSPWWWHVTQARFLGHVRFLPRRWQRGHRGDRV